MIPLKLAGTTIGSSDHLGVRSLQNMVVGIVYRPIPEDKETHRTFYVELTPNRKWDLTYTYWSCVSEKPMEKTVTMLYVGDGWRLHPGEDGWVGGCPDILQIGGILENVAKNFLISVISFRETVNDMYRTPLEEDQIYLIYYEDDPFHKTDKDGNPIPFKRGSIELPESFGESKPFGDDFVNMRICSWEAIANDRLATILMYDGNPRHDLVELVPQYKIIAVTREAISGEVRIIIEIHLEGV